MIQPLSDTVELGGALFQETLDSEQPTAVPDVRAAPWCTRVETFSWSFRSYLGAPIVTDGEAVGIVGFLGTETRKGPFSHFDLGLAGLIAQWIGIEIERRWAEEERSRLEAQVHRSQKMESLGVMASGIANDFSNLLVAILGNASLALEDMKGSPRAEGAVRSIVRAAKHASDITQEMLSFAGQQASPSGVLDLGEVVDEVLALAAASFNPTIEVTTGELTGTHEVHADPAQVKQVIMNLLVNAAEAIGDEGGTIHISLGIEHLTMERITELFIGEDVEPGPHVRLRVQDTGCGIEGENLDLIFDPFFTTKSEGRGLGLATVLGIMKTLGGGIDVESHAEEGTTFTLHFPHHFEASPVRIDDDEERADEWKGHGTVLVIESDRGANETLTHMLRRIGFEVLTAQSGQEGTLVYTQSDEEIRAAIVSDNLPGMDGWETQRKLREVDPVARVVITGAAPLEQMRKNIEAMNANAYLRKPYEYADLIRALRTALGEM